MISGTELEATGPVDARSNGPRDLSVWTYLGGPVFSLLICWVAPLLGYELWYPIMGHHELSFVEIATVVFLLPASVLGFVLFVRFLRSRTLPRRQAITIAVLMLILALGALYFGGEEMSWGQSYFKWDTPESWKQINKQNETNFHNTQLDEYPPWIAWIDDMLNNAPRQGLLVISVLGVILPVATYRWRKTPEARKSIWYWLIPTLPLVPICLLAATSTLPEKLARFLREGYGERFWPAYDTYVRMAFIAPGGELKEYSYGMMILFYFLSLLIRTSPRSGTCGGTDHQDR
jgi:hypothetical protein